MFKIQNVFLTAALLIGSVFALYGAKQVKLTGVFVVITLYGFNPIWPDDTYRSELLTSKVGRAFKEQTYDA